MWMIFYFMIRFRCLKYWLKGERKGRTEVFVDNLPGGPDNINLAPDGSFWIALLEVSNSTLDLSNLVLVAKKLMRNEDQKLN